MNSMPLKVVGKDVYLQVKSLYRQLKDPRPKRHQTLTKGMGQKNKGLYEGGGRRRAL
jgi:hypothetical protein